MKRLKAVLCSWLLVLTIALAPVCAEAQNNGWHRLSSLPSKALDGPVDTMLLFDDGTGPVLIAAGGFVSAGWQPALRVARWDGVAWTQLGAGFDDRVRALAIYRGQLIASGDFIRSGTRVVNRIARWNGSEWLPLNTGLSARGRAMTTWNDQLYVGGEFLNTGGHLVNRVAVWDGAAWAPMSIGLSNSVRALHIFENSLYAGGIFGVSRWTGSTWAQLPDLGTVFALTTFNGSLIAGGTSGSRVARWTGTQWAELASGLGPGGEVRAFSELNNSLVAAGSFTLAGNIPVRNVSVWNGSNWSGIGSTPNNGVSGRVNSEAVVSAVIVQGQELLFGGEFSIAGELGAPSIAAWSSAGGWRSFATGIADDVNSLSVNNGRLVPTGFFTAAPGQANGRRVATWDGLNWAALGTGINGPTVSAATFLGELVVAGSFILPVADLNANGIARWDGSAWRTLGSGLLGISAIAALPNDLVATAGGWSLWDANDWRNMNSPGAGRCAKVYAGLLYGCINPDIVARYESNGTWTQLGFIAGLRDIHVHQAEVYAAGSAGVFRWTGSNWTPVGNLSGYTALALTSWDGSLIAAGQQELTSQVFESDIRRFNGTVWERIGDRFEFVGSPSQPFFYDLEAFDGRLIAAGVFSGVAGRRAVNLMAFGPQIITTVEIVSAAPVAAQLGQPIEITVRVQAAEGVPVGSVSVVGSPRGACSTEILEPGINSALARCSITYSVPGPVQLTAQYSGGMSGEKTWAASQSGASFTVLPGDQLFKDGFEN